jgi:hypothetical protein
MTKDVPKNVIAQIIIELNFSVANQEDIADPVP